MAAALSFADAFQQAAADHRAGRLAEAEQVYRALLAADPAHPDTHFNLGLLAVQTGALTGALPHLRAAAEAERSRPEFWALYIATVHELGQHDAARILAETARARGLADPAIDDLECLIAASLVAKLRDAGRPAEAAAAARRAAAVAPAHAGPAGLLAEMALGRDPALAVAWYRRALAIAPAAPRLHDGLGVALLQAGRPARAAHRHRLSIALDPGHPHGYGNLCGVLVGGGRFADAIRHGRRSLTLQPDFADGAINLGSALLQNGQPEAAAGLLREALRHAPGNALLHVNLGCALLTAGDLSGGWPEYDWRRRTAAYGEAWRDDGDAGRPVGPGDRVVVQAEQGFGDTLQFCRYVPLLAAGGAQVTVLAPRPLLRLLRRLDGAAEVVETDTSGGRRILMMSLPRLFGTTLETIPAAIPYLSAPPDAVQDWSRRLGRRRSLRVGLAWAGNPRLPADARRSLAPALLEDLAAVPGIEFFSLQKDAAGMPAMPAGRFTDLTAAIGDFADTAALIANLDLVIAADSAVAHLAGAVGRPVWLLNRFDTEWRWLQHRADSPWYPTMRIFRQPAPGDWRGVIADIRRSLFDLVERSQAS